jgi:hypothetical protein
VPRLSSGYSQGNGRKRVENVQDAYPRLDDIWRERVLEAGTIYARAKALLEAALHYQEGNGSDVQQLVDASI